MSLELLAVLLGALAAVLGFDRIKAWRDRRQVEARLDRAQDRAQAAEAAAREARLAQARTEAQRERERAQAAAQKELDDGLQMVQDDLPGAVADALLDASGRGGDDAA